MTQAPATLWHVHAWGVALTLAIPPLVFAATGLGEGMGIGATVTAMIEQYTVHRQNLFLVALPSLAPIGLLVLITWLIGRRSGVQATRPLAIGGLLGILAVTVWINTLFWPLFLPARTYPGFPHGLEFIIGPALYAPAAMAMGMALAVAVRRSRRK